jgi:hypothetical protein
MDEEAETPGVDHQTWRRTVGKPVAPAIVPARGWYSNSGLAPRGRLRTPLAHPVSYHSSGNAKQRRRSWVAILVAFVIHLAGCHFAAIDITHNA